MPAYKMFFDLAANTNKQGGIKTYVLADHSSAAANIYLDGHTFINQRHQRRLSLVIRYYCCSGIGYLTEPCLQSQGGQPALLRKS